MIVSILLLALLILLLVIGFVAFFEGGWIISFWAVAFIFVPIQLHNHDVVNRDSADLVISEYEEYVAGLELQMNSLPDVNGALMNSDSPYQTIVTQLTEARTSLRDAKLRKINYSKSIKKRENGIFQWATWGSEEGL